MLSIFRGRRGRQEQNARQSLLSGSPETSRQRVAGRNVAVDDDDVDDEDDNGDDDDEAFSPRHGAGQRVAYFDQAHDGYDEGEDGEDGEEDDNEDGDARDTPLLPIFSAAHLDRLPLYNITHAIRLLIVQRCETTLSWEQLRSPQISQFLVKPVQNQIRTNHFNRATLCALFANALQFQKEAQLHPGNVGVSRTRALVSELLAMRLVKEFTTRELIDALSYDFDPLQGMSPATTAGTATPALKDVQGQRTQARGARVSTIEIAIRAQAKRFLAHPLVVQHLEAIWAGTVVFHSEADNLHRKPRRRGLGHQSSGRAGYGTMEDHASSAMPADSVLSRKAGDMRSCKRPADSRQGRRAVTLYDPRDASLFKLSRLRVPRYRQVFSTVSFAIMLGLFLAVLIDRSLDITALEVLFWFWSAGYMLDEVVGFTEQGFGLYIMSFWNAFDLGILLLFVAYYCLRLYSIVLADVGKHRIASMAYDVLASTAVLLFPRLFSVLDHYRYFSQLLIAFRLMAQDLMAILVLILISCSGFFVAFTLSFSDENTNGNDVAYALFQLLMGFTPAAWDRWPGYNLLGKMIMSAFLVICHFLIVTILITVLTNSFMAIVKNADEEHQFLFAVNTISMVKSDALFSYIAPTNVIGWLLSPLRYIMPFRQYVRFNRTIIKVTHFPVLFFIFGYERVVLSRYAYEPMDLIEKPAVSQSKPLAFSFSKTQDVFSPGRRLREPSVISFHKDRALEEVFRRPYRGDTMRTTTPGMDVDRRNSSNVVDQWMQTAENEGGASPPLEEPRSVLERLEHRRPLYRRAATAERMRKLRSRDFSTATRSVASDPDFISMTASRRRPHRIDEESEEMLDMSTENLPQETDADGDDENYESDHATPALGESALSVADRRTTTTEDQMEDEFYQTPTASKAIWGQPSASAEVRPQDAPNLLPPSGPAHEVKANAPRHNHGRNVSSATILFAPQGQADESSASGAKKASRSATARHSGGTATGTTTPKTANVSAARTPKRQQAQAARARPIMPPRQQTAPGRPPHMGGLTFLDIPQRRRREPSFNSRALDLASEIGDNKWNPSGGIDAGGISGMPASFSEQMMREREIEREREAERRRSAEEEKGMVNRILLARMNTLEEGFKEVLKAVKDNAGSSRRESEADGPSSKRGAKQDRGKESTHAMAPKTPIARTSGNEAAKFKKSPSKLQMERRNTKSKVVESHRAVHPQAASPDSVQTVTEAQAQAIFDDREDVGEKFTSDFEERPGTAFFTGGKAQSQ
ncbi:Ion transport protein [Teratosphaeria destructans]|uniref:Ion transport protein n=1 Tax=Teratosphaeria destructans TaxID=418781 RepID=A0A9W7SW20_9PEZI|nr:Ion transport protein [Teratosphaeria destructans]